MNRLNFKRKHWTDWTKLDVIWFKKYTKINLTVTKPQKILAVFCHWRKVKWYLKDLLKIKVITCTWFFSQINNDHFLNYAQICFGIKNQHSTFKYESLIKQFSSASGCLLFLPSCIMSFEFANKQKSW